MMTQCSTILNSLFTSFEHFKGALINSKGSNITSDEV